MTIETSARRSGQPRTLRSALSETFLDHNIVSRQITGVGHTKKFLGFIGLLLALPAFAINVRDPVRIELLQLL